MREERMQARRLGRWMMVGSLGGTVLAALVWLVAGPVSAIVVYGLSAASMVVLLMVQPVRRHPARRAAEGRIEWQEAVSGRKG